MAPVAATLLLSCIGSKQLQHSNKHDFMGELRIWTCALKLQHPAEELRPD